MRHFYFCSNIISLILACISASQLDAFLFEMVVLKAILKMIELSFDEWLLGVVSWSQCFLENVIF